MYSKILCYVHKDMLRLQVLSEDRTPKKIEKQNETDKSKLKIEKLLMRRGRETQWKAQLRDYIIISVGRISQPVSE